LHKLFNRPYSLGNEKRLFLPRFPAFQVARERQKSQAGMMVSGLE
jgi:hypothetical protein